MSRTRRPLTAVITEAHVGRSVDLDARMRRYLITMGVRVACFVAMIWVPGWWRLVLLAGAAILPAIAVLLANAQDLRAVGPPAPPDPDESRAALPSGTTIPGEVADDSPPRPHFGWAPPS